MDNLTAKKRPPLRDFAPARCALAALALFIAFYPLESGMPVSRAYASLLRWFNWINF